MPTRRRRLLRRLPAQLIEYPLEVLLAAWGLITGVPALLHLSPPSSLQMLLPSWANTVWSVMMALGGLTIAIGLNRHRYFSIVPRGMQLLASAAACYAVALYAAAGWSAFTAGGLLIFVAALLYLRAWWLRTREEMFHEIAKAAE